MRPNPVITNLESSRFDSLIESYRVYELDNQTELDLDPEGNFELIFQLSGDFLQRTYGTEEWKIRPKNFVGGLHSKSFQIRGTSEKSKLISVRFKPLGARHFMPDRLNLFKNSLIDLSDISKEIRHLELQGMENAELSHKLDAFLATSFSEYHKSVIDHAVEIISNTKGFIGIKSICNKLNISESHLRKLFNEQVGMSPKEYSKVLRINYISSILKQNHCSTLTQLSYELGYYDQAHFIKDFKSVTGRSPRSYLRQ